MSDSPERLSLTTRLLIALGAAVGLIIIGPLIAICAIEGCRAVLRTWNGP